VNANPGRWSSSSVPETGTFILVGIGLLGIAGTVLRRNRHGLDLPTPPIRTK
jgi:LPXTG-motif cell wall-anchored protein